jgi:hypothetical protein
MLVTVLPWIKINLRKLIRLINTKIVCDLTHYHFTRFLQSAEMLKPSTPTTSQDEEIIEYFPHLLFLQNRATTTDFSPSQVKLMQVCFPIF